MPNQKGVSGYLKNKHRTLKELNDAIDVSDDKTPDNAVDAASEAIEKEYEESIGITDRIRNIFKD